MVDRSARRAFLAAYRSSLRAVDPYLVTQRHLSGMGERLEVGGEAVQSGRGVRMLAVGKAAHGMARGVLAVLSSRLVGGLIISDHHRPTPDPRLKVMVGDHPYPGQASLLAGQAALALAAEGHPDELLLVLVSGGGSSLMEVPVPGITFGDLAATGRALVTGGVPISEMNVVRRHLSLVKNGGITRMAGRRPLAGLLISDVVDGPASAVASGPTVADGTTPGQARAVLADYRLEERVPPSVRAYLDSARSVAGPSVRRPFQVLADGREAARAAGAELSARGISAETVAAPVVGDAKVAAREVMDNATENQVRVYWGETTVRIDVSSPGRGDATNMPPWSPPDGWPSGDGESLAPLPPTAWTGRATPQEVWWTRRLSNGAGLSAWTGVSTSAATTLHLFWPARVTWLSPGAPGLMWAICGWWAGEQARGLETGRMMVRR